MINKRIELCQLNDLTQDLDQLYPHINTFFHDSSNFVMDLPMPLFTKPYSI